MREKKQLKLDFDTANPVTPETESGSETETTPRFSEADRAILRLLREYQIALYGEQWVRYRERKAQS